MSDYLIDGLKKIFSTPEGPPWHEARGNCLPEAPFYARQRPIWTICMRASRHSTVARVAQPATRVDTTCWQLFRPDINTVRFCFLLQKLCQITWLLTGWKKNFSTSGGAPEARGICHICHMVNPALNTIGYSTWLVQTQRYSRVLKSYCRFQWRPYRWCKWCGAPGPTTLRAHQRGPDSNFFGKINFFCFSRCQSQWLLQRDRFLNWS